MCQFPLFETISIIDGNIQNLAYHQQRFEQAVSDYFACSPQFALAEILFVPEAFKQGRVRCRIDYNAQAFEVKFFSYIPKKIDYFKVVQTENLDYHLKYAARKRFDFGENLPNGEWLIVNNGKVSDCTIGNLLFERAGQWFCSQDYLLKGTQLTKLLEHGQVQLTEISLADVANYERIMMVNALNPFDERRALPISVIQF